MDLWSQSFLCWSCAGVTCDANSTLPLLVHCTSQYCAGNADSHPSIEIQKAGEKCDVSILEGFWISMSLIWIAQPQKRVGDFFALIFLVKVLPADTPTSTRHCQRQDWDRKETLVTSQPAASLQTLSDRPVDLLQGSGMHNEVIPKQSDRRDIASFRGNEVRSLSIVTAGHYVYGRQKGFLHPCSYWSDCSIPV